MIPVGMLVTWLGYGVGSWGYLLVKGYNVTFREWMSPLSPYVWPAGAKPGTIPKGHLFPTGTAQAAPSGKAAPKAAGPASQSSGAGLQGFSKVEQNILNFFQKAGL